MRKGLINITPTEEKKAIFTKAVKLLDEIYWGGEELSTDNLTVLPELRKTLTPIQAEAAEAIWIARNKAVNALTELNTGREI